MGVLWYWVDPVTGLIYHSRCLLARLEAAGWEDEDLSPDVKAERRPMDHLASLLDTRVEQGLLERAESPYYVNHSSEAVALAARNGFSCADCGEGDLSDLYPLE